MRGGSRSFCARATSTGHFAWRRTRSATLPTATPQTVRGTSCTAQLLRVRASPRAASATTLDPVTARKVDELILQTRERFGVTSLVISHDMVQAMRLADRMYVLDQGTISAEGAPAELKNVPGSLAAAFFEASRIA